MDDKLTSTIQIKTTAEDKRILEAIAKKQRLSVSAYIRTTMLNHKPTI